MAPRRRGTPGLPSSRLAGLIEAELSGPRREVGDDGRARFVPVGDGPVLELASRVEKRFLGRTEIAVFRAGFDTLLPEEAVVALRHTGGLKRTGVTAILVEGGEAGAGVASSLATDPGLAQVLMPLDFTRFEVFCGPAGCRAEVELMGASLVAMALPPLRSYGHLDPDQRDAMISGFEAVRRVLVDIR